MVESAVTPRSALAFSKRVGIERMNDDTMGGEDGMGLRRHRVPRRKKKNRRIFPRGIIELPGGAVLPAPHRSGSRVLGMCPLESKRKEPVFREKDAPFSSPAHLLDGGSPVSEDAALPAIPGQGLRRGRVMEACCGGGVLNLRCPASRRPGLRRPCFEMFDAFSPRPSVPSTTTPHLFQVPACLASINPGRFLARPSLSDGSPARLAPLPLLAEPALRQKESKFFRGRPRAVRPSGTEALYPRRE